MAFDSALFVDPAAVLLADAPVVSERTDDFRRGERLVVVIGAMILGGAVSFGALMALGHTSPWIAGAIALPAYLLAMYLSVATFRDAVASRSFGCAAAVTLFGASMLAWPIAALNYPLSALTFWFAPAAALGSLLLLASCWTGAQRAIYRLCGQSALVAAGVAYFGTLTILG